LRYCKEQEAKAEYEIIYNANSKILMFFENIVNRRKARIKIKKKIQEKKEKQLQDGINNQIIYR
jgi:hypothetical protein